MSYREFLGIEIEHEDSGFAAISLVVHDWHRNDAGVVHGGVISTLIDVAIGRGIKTLVDEECRIATSALSVSFLSRCDGRKVDAEGRVIKHGRRLVYGDASVFCEGVLVAHGTGTWYVKAA